MRFSISVLTLLIGSTLPLSAAPLYHGTLNSTSWSGPYAGLHMGVMSGDIEGSIVIGARTRSASNGMNGFGGGALLGWNQQFDNWLVGIEGDVTVSNTDGKVTAFGYNVKEKSKWDSHIRARAGYLVTPDILAFAATGLAITPVEIKTNYRPEPNDDATMTGWSIGGGIEARLMDGVRGRLEYIYDNYSSVSMFKSVGGVDVDTNRHTARAALIFDLGKWME